MITIIPSLEEGWKKKERRRFGSVFVIRFVDDDGVIKFRWCPTCQDVSKMNALLKIMQEYDAIVSKIQIIKREQKVNE